VIGYADPATSRQALRGQIPERTRRQPNPVSDNLVAYRLPRASIDRIEASLRVVGCRADSDSDSLGNKFGQHGSSGSLLDDRQREASIPTCVSHASYTAAPLLDVSAAESRSTQPSPINLLGNLLGSTRKLSAFRVDDASGLAGRLFGADRVGNLGSCGCGGFAVDTGFEPDAVVRPGVSEVALATPLGQSPGGRARRRRGCSRTCSDRGPRGRTSRRNRDSRTRDRSSVASPDGRGPCRSRTRHHP
jgi:hypothetical protein